MIYKELIISNADELTPKVAASFVQIANQYDSQIRLEFSNKKINAKSIMGILSMGVKNGDSVYISATGKDEKEAAEALSQFVAQTFR